MNYNYNADNIVKPLASAVIGGVGAELLYPQLDKVVLGMQVPVYLFDGMVIGAASLVNATFKDQILARLGLTNSYLGKGSMLAGPIITGTTTVAATLILNGLNFSDPKGLLTLFLLGAVAEIGGHYTAEAFLKPVIPRQEKRLLR
jgi:hypothetical protein